MFSYPLYRILAMVQTNKEKSLLSLSLSLSLSHTHTQTHSLSFTPFLSLFLFGPMRWNKVLMGTKKRKIYFRTPAFNGNDKTSNIFKHQTIFFQARPVEYKNKFFTVLETHLSKPLWNSKDLVIIHNSFFLQLRRWDFLIGKSFCIEVFLICH